MADTSPRTAGLEKGPSAHFWGLKQIAGEMEQGWWQMCAEDCTTPRRREDGAAQLKPATEEEKGLDA